MRLFRYVGPKQIAERAPSKPAGTPIRSAADITRWILESDQTPGPDGSIIATFVVDTVGVLLVADRRSEHVACAGRQPVQSAGEMTFLVNGQEVEIAAVSNQSTGYCPEPESWAAVLVALDRAGLVSPAGFTLACNFRLCLRCGAKNLIKDGVFECGVCTNELPAAYNCQADEP